MTATLLSDVTLTAEDRVSPVAEAIRGAAAEAEAARRLPDLLVARLRDAGLLSLYVPREFGGLELPLPDALRVVEEVSRHDGSTGWTVALGVAAGVFPPLVSKRAAARVLGDGSPLIAGATAFGVRAVRVEGGYRLTGRWSFNSGARNATWFVMPVSIFDGDVPRMGANGPETLLVFLPAPDVQIIDTWFVTGLRATDTQDCYVSDVFVADEMTGGFSMAEGLRPLRDDPLTRIPFISTIGLAQVPPVCLGIVRRAIEEFTHLALTKESPFGPRLSEQVQAQVALARAEALLRAARAHWYENVDAIWSTAQARRVPSLSERTAMRLASLVVVDHSVTAVDRLHRLAGTTAVFQSSALERCWRDVHTAAQHLQVQEGRWETMGRILLGLEPGSPLV